MRGGKKERNTAGAELRALRESVVPKLSREALAARAGMPATSYQYYEEGYKKPYLPIGILLTLYPILLHYGVDRQRLLNLADPEERNVVLRQSHVVEVPLVTWVAAGKPQEMWVDNDIVDTVLIPLDADDRRKSVALKVKGNSMDAAGAPDGARILVDIADKELIDGKCYVVVIDGETVFKRFRANPPRFEADSRTERHDPIFINGQDVIVTGRVWRASTRL